MHLWLSLFCSPQAASPGAECGTGWDYLCCSGNFPYSGKMSAQLVEFKAGSSAEQAERGQRCLGTVSAGTGGWVTPE